ncbi:MAG: hypothetical protein H6741_22420 [Alphaproteobacteria bacterium]|nr:hypothetical protein [Alphaproteobacteria bacterium]
MRPVLPLLLLSLLGCDDGSVKLGDDTADTSVNSDDSATDDSATDDSAADDSAADDSGEPVETTSLTFEIEGEWAGTTLALTYLVPSDPPVVGQQLLNTEVTGPVMSVEVAEPREGELFELNPQAYPGLYAALYAPTLHVDSDGDGYFDGGEPIVAAGATWAWYLEGDLPQQLLILGFRQGWNAVELDFVGEGLPTVRDIDAIPLPADLWPVESLTLAGSYTAEFPLGDQRVAVISGETFSGSPPATLLYDEDLSESWSITLSGAPPADHWDTSGEINGAYEVAVTYDDSDGSGAFSDGDTPRFVPCLEDAAVVAVWSAGPEDLVTAVYMSVLGIGTGWGALALPAGGQEEDVLYLDAEAATNLEFSGGCALE